MSTMVTVEKQCGNCGKKLTVRKIMSTNAFGSPDLDLRPPEMKRSTMSMWLEDCLYCGYVSVDISAKPNFDRKYLDSEEYISCNGIDFSSRLAKTFYREALLSILTNNIKEAYENILYAAWCCDDQNDTENAILCRKKMDELFNQLPEYFKSDISLIIRHIDVLRRAEMFDKGISMCDAIKPDDDLMVSIVKFQKEKCIQHDVGVYTVSQTQMKQ